MYRFMIPVLTLALVEAVSYHSMRPPVASESQIKFAIENRYDDTGLGAKNPEYAYNTYRTLEEALLGYLDDPDTKLPQSERDKAVKKLLEPSELHQPNLMRFFPKTVEEYTGYTPGNEVESQTEAVQRQPIKSTYSLPESFLKYQTERPPTPLRLTQTQTERFPSSRYPVFQAERFPDYVPTRSPSLVLTRLPHKKYYANRHEYSAKISEPYRLQKVHQVNQIRGNPLNVAHYTREHDRFETQHNHPKYSFAYGVSEPETGDLKSAQEIRDGDSVSGYYSFRDADGKQRTVHYTADDQQGFIADVQRTDGDIAL